MKGFIFAAGYGERLMPITKSLPKALIPVLNIPSICYSLLLLKEAGITDVVCNLHYRPDDVRNFLSSEFVSYFDFQFSFEKDILGTGGGLKKCEDMFDDDFVILNSDVIADFNLAEAVRVHQSGSSFATPVLLKTAEAGKIGMIGVRNSMVIDFKNFLKTGVLNDYIYTGAAVLSPEIFRFLKHEFSSIVYTGYTGLIERYGGIGFYEHKGIWEDIGIPASLLKANMNLLGNPGQISRRFKAAFGRDIEMISGSAVIHGNASVKNSVIGEGCIVGDGAEVINSVLLKGSVVSDRMHVSDSIVMKSGIIRVSEEAQS